MLNLQEHEVKHHFMHQNPRLDSQQIPQKGKVQRAADIQNTQQGSQRKCSRVLMKIVTKPKQITSIMFDISFP